jgi:hypothetical protein
MKPIIRTANDRPGRRPRALTPASKRPKPKAKSNGGVNLAKMRADARQRDKLYTGWKEKVAAVNEGIAAALDAEVAVKEIVDNALVSRQHVYKVQTDIAEGRRVDGKTQGKAGRPKAPKKRSARREAVKPRIKRRP